MGVPGRGLGDCEPLDAAQLLPGVGGLTAQVTAGQGRLGQVTQAVAVTLPSSTGAPHPWVHPTLGGGGPPSEDARTELAATLTLSGCG